MTTSKERGICELYQEDPERADALIFGRVAGPNRRGFLKGAGLAAMSAAVGATIPFHRNMPAGLIPAALAESHQPFVFAGKDGLTVLNDRPVNAETPPHLLDDDVTPNNLFFVRNNGLVPEYAKKMDASGWSLTIDGEVSNPLTLTLDDLRSKFEVVKLKLQLECGGNGRAAFNPPARGNQWTLGAIGNAEWTGVRVKDVFKAAGIKESAVYTGYYGADVHLSGDPNKVVISRGTPIWKMMDPHTLLAFEMNGEPIPYWHGFPVRIVAPGWAGSVSGKWLKRIWVRDRVHDGPKMTGIAYRTPAYPVAPGTKVPPEDWRFIQSMPVKSLITFPKDGTALAKDNRMLEVRGQAWAGDNTVKAMHITSDFGATWMRAELDSPPNPYSWQRWRARIQFPHKGYYEIWARATDDQHRSQTFAINWNAKGYLNNTMHRIAVNVPT
jgi:DMSO/TMAO reductase YedYZ molybdopterin-dependent catalytic subunit